MKIKLCLKTLGAWLILSLTLFDLTADLGVFGAVDCCDVDGVSCSQASDFNQKVTNSSGPKTYEGRQDHACFTCCQHILPEILFNSHPSWMLVMKVTPELFQTCLYETLPSLPPPRV
jgi:hypothetical protein